MTAWSDLPNASHIDWVIASVNQHSEIWEKAWRAAWSITESSTRLTALIAGRVAIQDSIRDSYRIAAWSAAYGLGMRPAGRQLPEAYYSARDAILALIAYNDCANLLDMSSEQLLAWALLTEQPEAVLLLPAVIAREQISELKMS
jgi:hypothetical protein